MGDYYQHYLTSISGAGLQGYDNMNIPPQYPGMPVPMGGSPVEDFQQSTGYFTTGSRDSHMYDGIRPKGRKKSVGSVSGAEAVKHRRTRSGCFTCRSRRVKCDEKRPVCERCSKGSRECVYPDPPAPKAAKPRDPLAPTQQASPLSSSGDADDDIDNDENRKTRLETIPDEDETDSRSQKSTSYPPHNAGAPSPSDILRSRHGSETPSFDDRGSSPSSSTVTSSGKPAPYCLSDFTPQSEGRPDCTHLPDDIQYYLRWHYDNITFYHYGINHDTDDFYRMILPRAAMQNESLLNAVVGFTAYHATLQNPDGKLQDFLKYYNKSVTLLLTSLKRKEKASVYTLLTILQLATIEEYLGDWVNLLGHKNAAFEIFINMFPHQTCMQTPMGRMICNWFSRFDSFVAIMGGFPPSMPREHFDQMILYHASQIEAFEDNLRWKIALRSARLRQMGWDMALLYARASRGQILPQVFNEAHDKLTHDLLEWRTTWDPALTDPKYLVKDFPRTEPDPDDIVNPYKPGTLYHNPLLNSTVIAAEWISIMIVHKTQSTNTPPEVLIPDLTKRAYEVCQYYETMEFWAHRPNGLMLLLQAAIQMAILFLPQDSKHQMWARRKFALTEPMG